MSTSLLSPSTIKRISSNLHSLHTSLSDDNSAPAKALNKALDSLFTEAAKLDPKQKKHPQQQLFYLLLKGNQKAVDNMIESGVMSEWARDRMRGDPKEYKSEINANFDLLSKNIPLQLTKNSDGMAALSGATSYAAYHTDDALPSNARQALDDVVSGLSAYAISLDPAYSQKPLDREPSDIMKDMLSLSAGGQMLYEANNAIQTLVMDKFLTNASYESGNYREIYGSDALANIIYSVAKGDDIIQVPTENIKTDIVLPSLTKLSGLKINIMSDIPEPDTTTRANFASVLHAVEEKLNNATFADYNGNVIDDPYIIASIRNRFTDGVRALDDVTIGQYDGHSIATKWAAAPEPTMENDSPAP
jgi:hypothetical protein